MCLYNTCQDFRSLDLGPIKPTKKTNLGTFRLQFHRRPNVKTDLRDTPLVKVTSNLIPLLIRRTPTSLLQGTTDNGLSTKGEELYGCMESNIREKRQKFRSFSFTSMREEDEGQRGERRQHRKEKLIKGKEKMKIPGYINATWLVYQVPLQR